MPGLATKPAKPASLAAWKHMYHRPWTIPELLDSPPHWMAAMTGDGTILFGFLTGLKNRWPAIVVEMNGSQITVEVARETIIHCLTEGRPVRI